MGHPDPVYTLGLRPIMCGCYRIAPYAVLQSDAVYTAYGENYIYNFRFVPAMSKCANMVASV